MNVIWVSVASRAIFLFVAAVLLGWLLDWGLWPLLTVATFYLAWHLRHIYLLTLWLEQGGVVEPPDASGLWSEIFSHLHDMRRRNRLQKHRLSKIVAEFNASTHALPDAAIVIDQKHCISWMNESAENLLGLKQKSDRGQRLTNLLRHPAFNRYFEQGRGSGIYEDFCDFPSPLIEDNTVRAKIIPYGDGQRLLLVRDVSQIKRLDQMRQDFVANASHELRTPLTVLQGYLDMMLDISTEDQSQSEHDERHLVAWSDPIAEMNAQAVRMRKVIEDLLTLARLESMERESEGESVHAAALIEYAVEQGRVLSDGQHELSTSIDGNIYLRGEAVGLQSVFSNLVSNAVNYTEPGGAIHISLESKPDSVVFSVRDSGMGIRRQDIPRLTERFFRVDPSRSRATGGTGLGLSIVRHVLELHDATLHIASDLGRGSEFSCHFPKSRVAVSPDS